MVGLLSSNKRDPEVLMNRILRAKNLLVTNKIPKTKNADMSGRFMNEDDELASIVVLPVLRWYPAFSAPRNCPFKLSISRLSKNILSLSVKSLFLTFVCKCSWRSSSNSAFVLAVED